jgi:polysaccharide biosynthesis transport protein
MYITPISHPEPHNPISTQYPLRPAARTSPIRINVMRSLRLHMVTSIMVTLLVLGLGLAVVARHKPYYAAASVIYVSPTVPKTLVEDRELEQPYESYVQETLHAINRYDVLADAIHKMPPGLWQAPGEPERVAVTRLQHSMQITHIGNTYQVEIELEGYRPEHLADVVNIITEVYLEKAHSEEYYGRDDRLNTLKDERNHIQSEIDARLQEQSKITNALGVASFDGKGTNVFDVENAKMHADLTAAHEQRNQAEAQLAALTNGDPSAPNSALNAAADELIANDPGLSSLKTDLSKKKADIIEKLNGMAPSHPDRKQAESQLAQIQKELDDMHTRLLKTAADRLEQKLRTQLSQAQMYESKLNSDLQHGTKLAADAAPRIQRAEAIDADLTTLHAREVAVAERISNLELESNSPGSVHLFAPAMTPLTPEKSKIAALLILIFPFSIALGIITAVALDLLDPHIYNASDVEGVLGFAPIGMLFDDCEVTQMVFDECALRLAAGIDHAARSAGAHTFVITGVNSGAGTTSIIENLGSMLAKLGRKTLVIDPSGHSEPVAFVTFGTEMQKRPVSFPGESTGNPTVGKELQATKSARQSLPTRIPPLNSFVFESFQSLSAEYDIVLIDAAPVLISAETEYLARMADVTVLVVEAGKTKKAWLTRSARLLERMGVAGAAAVINKVHPARVEEALKDDLRDFELRSDRANLREWWKPGKKTSRTSAANASSYNKGSGHAEEEDVVFARDI